MRMLAALVTDARQALRSMRARPGFAFAAVAMLALGIGITTAMFTIVDALILRPVPFHQPDQLAFVYMGNERGGRTVVAPSVLRAWRESPAFIGAEAANPDTALVESGGSVTMRGSARVTPGLFAMLGNVQPIRGRLFDATEGRAGTADRVMLSEDVWRSLYGADPAILNSRVVIDGESLIVIGILPADFRFPQWNTVIWRPINYEAPPPARQTDLPRAYVRFAAGMPREEAIRLATDAARDADATNAKLVPRVSPLAGLRLDEYSQQATPLLAGAVMLVFIVLCANVCSLLLSRMTDARREFSIRAALGASRIGLIRQALVETGIVGAAGAVIGTGIAWAAVSLARTFLPESFVLQTLNPFDLDPRGLAAASIAGIAATLAAGVLPAWIGSRVDSGDSLRAVGRSGTDSRAARVVTRTLLIGEIALACTLLAGAVLLVRSFVNLAGVDRGLGNERAITATMSLPPTAFPDAPARAAVASALEQRIREIPGVQHVVWSQGLPPSGGGFMTYEWTSDGANAGTTMTVNTYNVTPDFFSMYGIPIVSGRVFLPSDGGTTAIVGQRLARALWGDVDPVGRTFTGLGTGGQPLPRPNPIYEVVGVAGEIHLPTLESRLDRPEFYVPFAGVGGFAMMSIGCGASCPDTALVQHQLRAAHPAVRVNEVRTLDSTFVEQLARPRAAAALAFAFALIAVVAAAGGLFSVLSYAVGRRRREFGIRAAVGASPAQLGHVVLREGAVVTLAGLTIGVAAATALGRALSSLQYGITSSDPVSWAMVIAVLSITAVAAAWRPTREAVRADPVVLLREE